MKEPLPKGLVPSLRRPSAYPDDPTAGEGVEVVQTHLSRPSASHCAFPAQTPLGTEAARSAAGESMALQSAQAPRRSHSSRSTRLLLDTPAARSAGTAVWGEQLSVFRCRQGRIPVGSAVVF